MEIAGEVIDTATHALAPVRDLTRDSLTVFRLRRGPISLSQPLFYPLLACCTWCSPCSTTENRRPSNHSHGRCATSFPRPSLFRRPSLSHRSQFNSPAQSRWRSPQSHRRHRASPAPYHLARSSRRPHSRGRARPALASPGARVDARGEMGEKEVGSVEGATRACGTTPPRRRERSSVWTRRSRRREMRVIWGQFEGTRMDRDGRGVPARRRLVPTPSK